MLKYNSEARDKSFDPENKVHFTKVASVIGNIVCESHSWGRMRYWLYNNCNKIANAS